MKVIGYVPLYYGKEYLQQCIESMHPHVEQIHIFYTPKPSQGFPTDIPCPETEAQLQEVAFRASDKIVWHKAEYGFEAEHRNAIMQYATGYDLIFTLDADEIVEGADIDKAFNDAYLSGKRYIGISGFINFWKSFNHACYDGYRPIRIINLRANGGEGEVNLRIYHFSTAQKFETIKYKWLCSGHKDELRQNWFDEVYKAWSPENNFTDLHPVAFGLWNATPFDKTTLPDILKQHPNYGKEVIE